MSKQARTPETNLYFDLTTQERESAIRYLLGAIIKCRREYNFPSNYYTFDEDVNVYLAHLLFAVSLPEYQDMAEPYLSGESSDVLNWTRATDDRTIRYFIFKVNADHILIHTAIFDDLHHKGQQKILKKSPKHFRELAQLYYDQAAVYHQRIYRKKTGVGEVLEKLAKYFDVYQALLRLVRREYFDFMSSFRDQAFSHFLKEFRHYEAGEEKKRLLDDFLDLYGKWLSEPSLEVEMRLGNMIHELKTLDPDFHFELKRPDSGGWNDERKCA